MQIEHGNTDEAVLAVFAALVWHTQQLREDVQKLGQLKTMTVFVRFL